MNIINVKFSGDWKENVDSIVRSIGPNRVSFPSNDQSLIFNRKVCYRCLSSIDEDSGVQLSNSHPDGTSIVWMCGGCLKEC